MPLIDTAELFSFFELGCAHKIQVWTVDLDQDRDLLHKYSQYISEEEHKRAHRYCFPHDSERFMVRRGVLRFLLGTFLDQAPEEIEFTQTAQGKPYLKAQELQEEVHFSVSQSGPWAVFAIARKMQIGIDVELVRARRWIDEVVTRHFALREQQVYQSLLAHDKIGYFYSLWTGKEACIKTLGENLTWLDHFDLSFLPAWPQDIQRYPLQTGEDHSFFVYVLPISSLVRVSLAVTIKDQKFNEKGSGLSSQR